MKIRRSSVAIAVAGWLGSSILLRPLPLRAAEPDAAEPPTEARDDDSVRAARAAFREAAGEARKGNWSRALEAFNRSYTLHPHPVTSYDIGYCERAIGHFTRARSAFTRALREREADSGASLPPDLTVLAEQYRSEAERTLASVELEIPAGIRLAVDGRPLQEEVAPRGKQFVATAAELGPAAPVPKGKFRLLVDPGDHVFVVSRSGAPDLVVTRHFQTGEATLLRLPLPAQNGQVLPLEPASTRAAAPDHSWSYALFGVGAAGVVVGTVAGLVALHKRAILRGVCGPDLDACPPNRAGDLHSLKRSADASTIAFAGGGVAAGVGLVMLLVAREPKVTRFARAFTLTPSAEGALLDVAADF